MGLIVAGLYPVGRYIWATNHHRLALQALDKRDFASARSHLAVCLNEWPTSAETQFLAARTARRAGDLDAAQLHLKEASKLGWVPEAINLERALLTAQRGQYQTVAPTLMSFVRRGHPDSTLIVEILAPLYLKTFQLIPALECLDFWAKLDPENPRPFLLRGDVHHRMMRGAQAQEDFERAVALDPDNEAARLQCGNLLLQQRFPEKAKPHFDWLWERRPEDPAVKRGMANCLASLGRGDEARKILEGLVQANPDDAITFGILGQLELNALHFDQAEKWLKKAAAAMPHELSVLYLLALALENNNKVDEANAIRKRLKRTEDIQDRAKLLLANITRTPQDAEVRRQLALCLIEVGMEDDARRWLESGLQMNPRHRATYETLGDLYTRLGDLSKADMCRKNAADLPPSRWWRPDQ